MKIKVQLIVSAQDGFPDESELFCTLATPAWPHRPERRQLPLQHLLSKICDTTGHHP